MKFLYIVLLFTISQTYAWLDLKDYPDGYPFDRELHRSVLDPEMCKRQLDYLLNNDTLLLMNFLDAGPRIPKGILGGNLRSTGNFYQCLGINSIVDDMDIDGKYCNINIPLHQNIITPEWTSELPTDWSGDWLTFFRNVKDNGQFLDSLEKMERKQSDLKKYLFFVPSVQRSALGSDQRALSGIEFQVALCIPKACTTNEVINSVVNISALGFEYRDNLCRLPNDKHWVTADYIAISVFSVLGFIIAVSTLYDLCHLYYFNKDPKETHPLRMFSGVSNISMLMDISTKPGSLQCLDGIRALAISWVILGHTFVLIPPVAYNMIDIQEWQSSLRSIWVTGGLLTVDTFFMLSGLLLVYISMAKYTSTGLLKNLHVFYLNRLLRIFPILALAVLFEASIYNRLSDGAYWDVAGNSVHTCRAFWWSTLLHLQNFLNPLGACLPVTWYLAIDVQLHLLSPLILFWLLRGSKRSSWGALIIALLVSLAIATSYMFLQDMNQYYFAYYYVNILTRSPPFFVGLIVGYFLRVYRDKEFKMSTVLSACVTAICIALTWTVMYVNYLKGTEEFDNITLSHIIDSFTRSIWAAALGWIIFVCVNGYGGPINWFLSMKLWRIPARISYAMYVVHFSIKGAYYSSKLDPIHYSVGTTVFRSLTFLVITAAVSILLTGLVDIPISMLFKIALDKVAIKTEKPQAFIKESVRPKETGRRDGNGNINEGYVRDDSDKEKSNL